MNPLFQRRDFWIGLAALVVLAIALAQRPWRLRGKSASAPMPPSRPVMPETGSQLKETQVLPKAPPSRMDTGRLAVIALRWRELGGPDPFGAPLAKPRPPIPDPFAGLDQLQFSAVWRQPGRRLAVINRQVVAEGDSIAGFRIEHCEAAAVWMAGRGASRRVRLPRPAATAASPSNSPASQHLASLASP